MPTTVTFIGSAALLPDVGRESASFLINRNVLVDCGWSVGLEMRRYGVTPLDLDALLITHCHHDHVMGLPALLFYRGMRPSETPTAPLRIYGPADEMPETVANAKHYLRADRFPEIWSEPELFPLEPGDERAEPTFQIKVERTYHGVPGLAYRLTDPATGAVVAFTGDTGYKPDLADLFRGADLLIHEATFRPERPAQPGDTHCSAADAARIARDAGVKRLALIHYLPETGPAWLAGAQAIFPDTMLAEEGVTVTLP